MKLFKISQTAHRGWDTYSNAIVCANDADEAGTIHPDKKYGKWFDTYTTEEDKIFAWENEWTAITNVLVEYIGEAKAGLEKGVVCASFHAG